MTDKQKEELNKIRHYLGTVKDFKSFWDEQAGGNTNAFGTPEKQGYEVHPTREEVDSPHWKTVSRHKEMNEQFLPTFENFIK